MGEIKDIEKFRQDVMSYIDYIENKPHGKKKALKFIKRYVDKYNQDITEENDDNEC